MVMVFPSLTIRFITPRMSSSLIFASRKLLWSPATTYPSGSTRRIRCRIYWPFRLYSTTSYFLHRPASFFRISTISRRSLNRGYMLHPTLVYTKYPCSFSISSKVYTFGGLLPMMLSSPFMIPLFQQDQILVMCPSSMWSS